MLLKKGLIYLPKLFGIISWFIGNLVDITLNISIFVTGGRKLGRSKKCTASRWLSLQIFASQFERGFGNEGIQVKCFFKLVSLYSVKSGAFCYQTFFLQHGSSMTDSKVVSHGKSQVISLFLLRTIKIQSSPLKNLKMMIS